jgi:hypothetical protein
MGIDTDKVEIISVYEGSIVVIYDLKSDDSVSKEQLLAS